MNKEVKRFAKFSVVGLTNTVIDIALFNILLYVGLNIYLATSIAFLFAVTNSYFLNRSWTFSDRKSHQAGRQYSLFLLVALCGLAVNNIIVFLALHFLHIANPLIKANIIRLSAIGVVVFWNYGMSRFVVFKDKPVNQSLAT